MLLLAIGRLHTQTTVAVWGNNLWMRVAHIPKRNVPHLDQVGTLN